MQKLVGIAVGACAALALAMPRATLGQVGLERQLAAAKRLECSFGVLGRGNWDAAGKPSIAVTDTELTTAFYDINVDEGTAEAETDYGSSFISVRLAQGYLHIMQMSDAGPLYLTTVLARAAGQGRLMAIHMRVEYTPVSLPGFTSRPETYLGSCAIVPA